MTEGTGKYSIHFVKGSGETYGVYGIHTWREVLATIRREFKSGEASVAHAYEWLKAYNAYTHVATYRWNEKI